MFAPAVAVVLVACGTDVPSLRAPGAPRDRSSAPAPAAATPPPAAATTVPDSGQESAASASDSTWCPAPAGGLVLDSTRVGNLRFGETFAALDARCPGVESDSSAVTLYTIGGTQPLARVYRYAGARVYAMDEEAGFGDSLRRDARAGSWAAEGDSLRLADGTRLPRTFGELRARYRDVIVVGDRGDDSDGTKAYVCRFPWYGLVLPWETATPAGAGPWSAAARPVPDATRIERVEYWGTVDVRAECARLAR